MCIGIMCENYPLLTHKIKHWSEWTLDVDSSDIIELDTEGNMPNELPPLDPYKSKKWSEWTDRIDDSYFTSNTPQESSETDYDSAKGNMPNELPPLDPYKSKSWSEWIDRIEDSYFTSNTPQESSETQDSFHAENFSIPEPCGSVRHLPRKDINLYGIYPKMEPRVFLLCKKCSKVLVSNGIYKHCLNHHSMTTNKPPEKLVEKASTTSSRKKNSPKSKKRTVLPKVVPPSPVLPVDEVVPFSLDSPPQLQAEFTRCKKSKKLPSTITKNDPMDLFTTSSPEQDDNNNSEMLQKLTEMTTNRVEVSPQPYQEVPLPIQPVVQPEKVSIGPLPVQNITNATVTNLSNGFYQPVIALGNQVQLSPIRPIPIVLRPLRPAARPIRVIKIRLPHINVSKSVKTPQLVSLPSSTSSSNISLLNSHPKPLIMPTASMRRVGGSIMLQSQHLERQRNNISLALNCDGVVGTMHHDEMFMESSMTETEMMVPCR